MKNKDSLLIMSNVDLSTTSTGHITAVELVFNETGDIKFDRNLYNPVDDNGSPVGTSNAQVHHIIPKSLIGQGDQFTGFFEQLGQSTDNFVFSTDSVDNLVVLPASSANQAQLDSVRSDGLYAATHTGGHPSYRDLVAKKLSVIQAEFNSDVRNLDPGSPEYEAAASKAGNKINQLTFSLREGLQSNNLDDIKLVLNKNDSLQELRHGINLDDLTDDQKKELLLEDHEKLEGIEGDGNIARRLDSSGNTINLLDSGIKSQIGLIMGDNVSGKMGNAAIAITIEALRKMIADYMQKEDLTLAEMAEFLVHAGIENFDKDAFLELAEDAAAEAVIGLALSTLRGPWAWIYTGYEVYENYGALRGSLELAGLAYPDNVEIAQVNRGLTSLEDNFSELFNGNDPEPNGNQIDPYIGSIDLGTTDLPESDPNYRLPSLDTMQIPVTVDEYGNALPRDFSEYDNAALNSINNPIDIANLFTVVDGNPVFNSGALDKLTSTDSNVGYEIEYNISYTDSVSGGQTVTDSLTYRYPDGSIATVERSYTLDTVSGVVIPQLDSYEFKAVNDQGQVVSLNQLTKNLNSAGLSDNFTQTHLDTLNELAYMSEVGEAGTLTVRYDYDEDGEIQSRVEFSPNEPNSLMRDLDFTGVMDQADFNHALLNLQTYNPLADVIPEQVFPNLASEVEEGQYLVFKPNGVGAEILDQDGLLHGEVFYDSKTDTTTTLLYPSPRDKGKDYRGDYIIEKTEDGELKAFQDPGKEFNAREKIVEAENQRRIFYGHQLGSGFGQLLGLNGSDWQKQIAPVLFGSLGRTLAESTISDTSEATMAEDRSDSFIKDFGINFAEASKGAAEGYIGAFVTQFVMAEVGVDEESEAGKALATAATPYVTGVVSALVDASWAAATASGETVNVGAKIAENASEIEFSTIVATYIGKRLGAEMYSVETQEGGITGAVGAAIGAKIGASVGSIFPGVGTFIGAVVGATLGYLVGAKLGDLFGTPPEATATLIFDHDTQEFVIEGSWSRGGADKGPARDMARSASQMMSSALEMTGGEVIGDGTVYGGTWGYYKDRLTYRPEGRSSGRKKFKDSQDLFNFGVVKSLSDIKLAGGNVFTKRAYYSALEDMLGVDSISEYINNKTPEIEKYLDEKLKGKDALSFLVGRIQVGIDYANYRSNSAVINALMVLQPDTPFFTTWQAALTFAQELRLDKRHEADYFGGWRYLFDTEYVTEGDTVNGIVESGAYYASADFSYEKNQRIIELKLASGVTDFAEDLVKADQKEIIKFVNQQVLDQKISEASIKTVSHVIEGNDDARDIIKGDNSGNDIFGGSGNDELRGGKLADWIDGGADNDDLYATGGDGNVLLGGSGNDKLFGASGSDWLLGGADKDTLEGGRGADILDGGEGDQDVLKGGAGNDVYIFRRGYGTDTINDQDKSFNEGAAFDANFLFQEFQKYGADYLYYNYGITEPGQTYGAEDGGGIDIIEFAEGISLGDINLQAFDKDSGDKLVITLLDENGQKSGDTLTIENWSNIFRRIEQLRFSDGQIIDLTNIQSYINGTAGNDALLGTDGADFISAGAGDDIVDALAGNDVAVGGLGSDIVTGGADHDLVVGGSGSDNLYGASGNDVVSGGQGNDFVYGGSGNDILSGGVDDDTVVTGAGNDTILFGHSDGHDLVIDNYSSAPVLAATIKLTLIGDNNYEKTDPSYELGFSSKGGGSTLAVWDSENNRLADGYFGQSRAGDKTIFDIFYLGQLAEIDSGNDTIEFKRGVSVGDIRVKREGNDLVVALEGNNNRGDEFDQLNDSLRFSDWFSGNAHNIESFRIFDLPEEIDLATISNWISGEGDDSGDDVVAGDVGRDWITTGAGNDVIDAKAGDDIVNANTGDDVVKAGDGDDILFGGSGVDTLSYEGASQGQYANLSRAKYYTQDQYEQEKSWDNAEANGQAVNRQFLGDRASGFENLTGTDHDDILIGDRKDNELSGGKGSDYLVGGDGNDSYYFQIGDGSLVVSEYDLSHGVKAPEIGVEDLKKSGEDSLVFGEGIKESDLNFERDYPDLKIRVFGTNDEVVIKNWFLGDSHQIETLKFADGGEIDIRYQGFYDQAGDFDDWVGGTSSNDSKLEGFSGNDILSGRAGNDVLDGGVGDDRLYGGIGADKLIGGEGTDAAFYLDSEEAIKISLENTFKSSGGSAEGDTFNSIENIAASRYDDEIHGSAYRNTINGHDGDDVILGLEGDDTLQGGAGNDDIEGGRGADTITGGAGDDILKGGIANDLIDGGSGDDEIYGGLHSDTLSGAAGDDTIDGGSHDDLIIGGEGNDTLIGGQGDDKLFGNEGIDTLRGGAGSDELKGENGIDYLYGNEGNDGLEGDAGDDELHGGDGNDILQGGRDDDDLWGDSGEDLLIGGEGQDNLYGGSGADFLIGGEGNDRLEGQSGSDTYIFEGNFGQDSINESLSRQASDEIIFSGRSLQELWFKEVGSDLIISVIGTDNQVTIENYARFNVSSAAAGAAISRLEEIFGALTPIEGIQLDTQRLNAQAITAIVDSMDGIEQPSSVAEIPSDISSLQEELAEETSIEEVIDYVPELRGRIWQLQEDESLSGQFEATDRNPSDVLTYRVAEASNFGELELNSTTGAFTYTPIADFSGNATFGIEVTDSRGLSTLTRMRFHVVEVDDIGSVASRVAIVTAEESSVAGTIDFSDNDSTFFNYEVDLTSQLGRFDFNADGTFVFTPFDNAYGEESIDLTLTDTNGQVIKTTFDITVNGINERPETPELIEINALEDSVVSSQISVTDNDLQDTHRFEVISRGNGTLHWNGSGSFDYELKENFSGIDTFTVRVYDDSGDELSYSDSVVRISVAEVNDSPTAADSINLNVDEDQSISGDLLAGDVDLVYGDSLSYQASPNSGQIVFNSDGTFQYSPDSNFNGSDSFVITISDASGASAQTELTVNVLAVNDAPITSSNVDLSVQEDGRILGSLGLVDVDSIYGDSHTFSATPALGAIEFNANGSFTYTPFDNVNGTDTFTVTVVDSEGASSQTQIRVNVNAVNDTPDTVENLSLNTLEDQSIVGNLSLTDVDLLNEGDTHSFEANPQLGEISFNADGSFVYLPNADVNGTDNFQVTITDEAGAQSVTQVSINISAVNDALTTATAIAITTLEDNAITGDISLSDPDLLNEGDSYTFTASPNFGEVIFNQNGTFTYTPDSDVNGADAFTVTVTDSAGEISTTDITVNVTPVNDAPEARDVYASVIEDQALVMALPVTDIDGDTLEYRQVNSPRHGIAEISDTGELTYTPADNFFGSDRLLIEVSDGQGGTDELLLNLYVNPVNDDPFAYDLVIEADSGKAVSGAIYAGDYDPQDILTYSLDAQDGADNGGLTLDAATGVFTYQSSAEFIGTDNFTVVVNDNAGGTTSLRVAVIVSGEEVQQPGNVAPEFSNLIQYESTDEDEIIELDLRATDSDDDTLTYQVDNSLSSGRGRLEATGQVGIFRFIPNENVNGSDAFRLIVNDGKGGSDSLLLQLNINPINDAPELSDQSFTVQEDVSTSLALADVFDVDGDELTFRLVNQAGNGQVNLLDSTSGRFSYLGTANFNGTDTFDVEVSDDNGGQSVATITINVSAVNDAPEAPEVINLSGQEDTVIAGNVAASDVDGDVLTYRIDINNEPENGSVIINADGTFNYTPADNYNGSDQFAVIVDDNKGGSHATVVNITAAAANDAPYGVQWLGLFSISENSVSGEVGRAQVQDVDLEDDPASDNHSYRLTNSAAGRFIIDSRTGAISVASGADLNFENHSTHSIEVEVTDSAGAAIRRTQIISLQDENEAPIALVTSGLSINEDVAAGTVVGQILVTDPDQVDSFTYALTNNAAGRFTINAQGQIVTLLDSYDIDGDTTQSITVEVADKGGLKIQQGFSVTINAVNHAPIDISWGVNDLGYSTIDENVATNPQRRSVGFAKAVDDDTGDTHTYALLNNMGKPFGIDSSTGEVYALPGKALDHELQSSFTLTVQVTDSNGETYSENREVRINDLNEKPSSLVITDLRNVTENTGVQTVAKVKALDPENNAITYSLDGADASQFQIDVNGNLRTNRSLNHEERDSYTFDVVATDTGGLSRSQSLTVRVNDVNELPSSITAIDVGVDHADLKKIEEGEEAVVGSFLSVDPDGNSLTYRLTQSSSDFALSSSGELTLKAGHSLDANNGTGSKIFVEVSDGSLVRLQEFIVPVSQDRVPYSYAWAGTKEVVENQSGALIGTVTISDHDQYSGFRNWDVYITKVEDSSGNSIAGIGTGDFEFRNNNNGTYGVYLKNSVNVSATVDAVVQFSVSNAGTDGSVSLDGNLGLKVHNLNTAPVAINSDNVERKEYSHWRPEVGSGKEGYESGWDVSNASLDLLFTNSELSALFSKDPGEVLSYRLENGNSLFRITANGLEVIDHKLMNAVNNNLTTHTLRVSAHDGNAWSTNSAIVNVNITDVNEYQVVYDGTNARAEKIELYGGNWSWSMRGEVNETGYRMYGTFDGPKYAYFEGSTWVTKRQLVENWRDEGGLFTPDVKYDPLAGIYVKFHNWTGNSFSRREFIVGYESNEYDVRTNGKIYKNWDYFPALSPVAIDLGGDSIEFVEHIKFDANNDGQLDAMPWVGANDALLALDRNADGAITNGSEISFVDDLPGATTDLEGLAAFDSNQNNLLDAGDERFNEFKVWQDKNQNGISEINELSSLTEAGIESITLNPLQPNSEPTGVAGVELINTSIFTRADGSSSAVGDVKFDFKDIDSSNPQHSAVVSGDAFANSITGTLAADNIESGDGNDSIFSGENNDWVKAGTGDDLVFGGQGDDRIEGQAGADRLYGDAGDDIISGGEQDDALYGGEGNDSLYGSHGDDRLEGASGDDELYGGEGNDVLVGGDGFNILVGGKGSDQLSSDNDNNLIVFNAGDGHDVVSAKGFYQLQLVGIHASQIVFEESNEGLLLKLGDEDSILFEISDALPLKSIVFDNGLYWDEQLLANEIERQLLPATEGTIEADHLTGGSYDDYIDTYSGNDTVYAGSGNDVVSGYAGNDHLFGESGNDVLDGGRGDDILSGGAGNDRLYGQSGHDEILGGSGTDSIYGGAGNDRIDSGEGDDKVYGGEGDDQLDGQSGEDFLDGGDGIDQIHGGAGVDELYGGAGNDTLSGGADDDYLQADEGDDVVTGGEGNDIINLGSGDDIARGNIGDDLLVGDSGNDQLFGDDGVDTLFGDQGNDVLDGGAGNDNLFGGLGDDVYLVDSEDDLIEEKQDQGIDTVQASVDWSLGDFQENLTLLGDALSAVGNELDNQILGNDRDNVLDGKEGVDTLTGGMGSDTYFVDNVADITIEAHGEGDDRVIASVDFSLADHIETLELAASAVSGTGNTLDNYLKGNSANNSLSGLQGDDTLEGGKGDDYLLGGEGVDTIRFTRGDGIDTVASAQGTYKLHLLDISKSDIEFSISEDGLLVIDLGQGDKVQFEGLDQLDSEESLPLSEITIENSNGIQIIDRDDISRLLETELATHTGSDQRNIMWGSFRDDRMHGFAGNDVLLGLSGDDVILGGTGDDSLYGGIGSDHLIGGDGNDFLNASIGDDTLDGGIGNDKLWGGIGNDSYLFNIGDGRDTVFDIVGTNTIKFGSGIERDNLVLVRNGKEIIVKYSESDQVVLKNAYKTSFFDKAFDHSEIKVSFNDGTEITLNELRDSNPVQLFGDNGRNVISASNRADEIFGLAGNDKLFGGSGNDILHGGEGSDRLYGGQGSDLIHGGAGNDILFGGSGDDVYSFAAGDGHDFITDQGGRLEIDNSISLNDLVFAKGTHDLSITSTETGDRVDVVGWYIDDSLQLDTVSVSGYELSAEMIGKFVQANAALSEAGSDEGGSMTLSNEEMLQKWMSVG